MNSGRSRSGKKKSNQSIVAFIYFFALLFFGMIAYMIYFIGFRAEDLMGNSYNARMDVFNNRFIRGSILSADGQVLAKTNVQEEKDPESGENKKTEIREYPFGDLFAQSVGYSTKGKTGIEALANFYLMESNSNPVVQVANEITETKSQGDSVVTTFDTGLQKVAYDALGEKRGAVIAMNPQTGEVLCMVSKPSFDPNTIVQNWNAIVADENAGAPLLNRCTQGLYAPGSTFKIIMTLEYLREHPDYSDFHYNCKGLYQNEEDPAYVVHCFNGEKHGKEDLAQAFANSCNSAFAEMGTEIDKKKLKDTAQKLMFNEKLPVELPSSKSRFTVTEESDAWTMMQSAIGQGNTMMSPLHEVMITSAIANKGVLCEPKLLTQVLSSDGNLVKTFPEAKKRTLMTESEADTLGAFMRKVVTEGTASKFRKASYEAAGKTGSAEVTDNGVKKTNAWFTGFAPYENPQIAVCVIVEDGETGGRTAVPVAKAVMDYWLSKQ